MLKVKCVNRKCCQNQYICQIYEKIDVYTSFFTHYRPVVALPFANAAADVSAGSRCRQVVPSRIPEIWEIR